MRKMGQNIIVLVNNAIIDGSFPLKVLKFDPQQYFKLIT